jgi:hypothetical protein
MFPGDQLLLKSPILLRSKDLLDLRESLLQGLQQHPLKDDRDLVRSKNSIVLKTQGIGPPGPNRVKKDVGR